MAKRGNPTLADAKRVLGQESQAELLRLVLGWAEEDERLRERILQFAARRLGKESAVTAAARAFHEAVKIRSFIPYREAAGWAERVDHAIDNFEELLAAGHAAEAAELCELALGDLTECVGSIDDSNGELTDLSERLQEIHFRACERERPDGVELARRLFPLELGSEVNAFYNAALRYKELLGDEGLAEYGRLTDIEPAADYRVQMMHESIARALGDVEKLAAVLRRDLTQSYHYALVAEAYREAKRYGQALEWAEKGIAAFPKPADMRLSEIAAGEYHRLKQHDKAMGLMWAVFLAQIGLASYEALLRHAETSGEKKAWRARALAEIRERISRSGRVDRSLLVEIFLSERNSDAAWDEAQAGGCSDYKWLALADARDNEHPSDTGPVYLRLGDAAVAAARNSRYEEPVRLLLKASSAMRRSGHTAEFARRIDELRAKHKAKRNFIQLLNQKLQAV